MIDFFFAVIAAGVSTAGGEGGSTLLATPTPAPAPEVIAAPAPAAPATPTPTPTTPTVTMGSNVTVGTGSVVVGGGLLGGTAETVQPAAPAVATGGGLLGGTSDTVSTQPAAPATAAAPAPAALAPAAPAVAGSEFNMAVVPAGLVAEPQNPSGKFTTAMEVKPIMEATKGNWVAVREYEGQDILYVTHIWGWRCGIAAMAISVNDEPMQNWPLPPCHLKYSTPNAMLEDDGNPYLKFKLGSVQKIEIQLVYDDLTMARASFDRGNVLIP